MQDPLAALVRVLDEARARGARGTEVLRSHREGVQFRLESGSPAAVTVTQSDTIVVRVWLEGGRRGEARGPAEQLDLLLTRALAGAEDAPEDPFGGPVDRLARAPRGLGTDDRRFEHMTLDDKAEVVTSVARSVGQVDRALHASGLTWADEREVRSFVSSKGLRLTERTTTYSGGLHVRGATGTDIVTMSDELGCRTFASIASVPYGSLLARRVVAALQPVAHVDAGPIRVVLAPYAVGRLFAQIAAGFTDDATSFFLTAEGAPAHLHPKLHLLDDGQLTGGLRTRAFDDRGVIPVPLTLIRDGVVDARLTNPRDARRQNIHPTGHVCGDRSEPSNLTLRTGTRSINALTSEIGGTFLRIEDLPPLDDAIDLATGRLRCTVSGTILNGNRPVGAVRNRVLSGSLSEVFTRIVDVTNDTDRVRSVDAPGMILDGFHLE